MMIACVIGTTGAEATVIGHRDPFPHVLLTEPQTLNPKPYTHNPKP